MGIEKHLVCQPAVHRKRMFFVTSSENWVFPSSKPSLSLLGVISVIGESLRASSHTSVVADISSQFCSVSDLDIFAQCHLSDDTSSQCLSLDVVRGRAFITITIHDPGLQHHYADIYLHAAMEYTQILYHTIIFPPPLLFFFTCLFST